MAELVSVKETFGRTLLDIGAANADIVVLDADLARASGAGMFAHEFPDRYFQVGVAEQNLISISAGLALSGKIAFASTFSCFAVRRACDQVINSVAYNKANVKICGDYGGFTQEKNGGSHMSLEDFAIMRSIPGMTVVEPADTVELEKAMWAISAYDGPVYLRKPRGPMPSLFGEDHRFEIGKAQVLTEGDDASIIACGIMVAVAIEAHRHLENEGVHVRVVNMPTIKPLDEQAVLDAARKTGAIVTAENHSILGGLGGAVCELLSERCRVPVKRIGIPDRFGETATLDWLLEKSGMTMLDIVEAVHSVRGQARDIKS